MSFESQPGTQDEGQGDGAAAERRKLLSDTLFVALVTVLGKFRGLVFLPIVTKTAGAAAYGVWVQVLGILSLWAPLTGLNLHQALVRFAPAESDAEARRTLRAIAAWTLPASALVSALLALQAEHLVRPLLGDGGSASILVVTMALVPFYLLARLGFSFYRARGRIKFAHLAEALVLLGGMAGAAAAFALGAGVLGGVLALGASVVLWCAVVAAVALRGPVAPARISIRPHVGYALPTIPTALSDWALALFDRFVLAYVLGSFAVGAYSATYAIAQLVAFFAVPFEYALLPVAARRWDQGAPEAARGLVAGALRAFLVASLPAALVLIAVGQPLLSLLATREVGAFAVPLLVPLALGHVLWGATRMTCLALFAAKASGRVAAILGAGAVVNVLANVALVPRVGAAGAAWATFLAYGLTLALAWRRTRLAVAPRFFLALALGAGAMLIVLALAGRLPDPWSLAAGVPAACLAFFATVWAARGVTAEDLALLRGLLPGRRGS